MFWKAVTLFGLALGALGERYATSEQTVKQEFGVHDHHGGLQHIGSHLPEHHEEYAWAYPSYEFSYSVNDPHTHDYKGQREHRLGDEVNGEYWLLQPDGRKRTVKYQSDKHKGFKAEVHYSEHEHHHKHHVHEHHHKHHDHEHHHKHHEHEKPRIEEVIKPVVEVVKQEPERPAEIEPVIVEEIPVAVVEEREEERIEPRHTTPKHYKPIHIEYYVSHKYHKQEENKKHHTRVESEEKQRDQERREEERREKERQEAERREAERREKESEEAERREAERRQKENEDAERREEELREKESEEAERREERRREKEMEDAERREAERRENESEVAERREEERREEERKEAERNEEERREKERRREEKRLREEAAKAARKEEKEHRKPVHIEYFSNIHHPIHNENHGYEIPRHHYYKHVEVEEHNPINVEESRAERKHEPHVQLLRMHKPLLFRPEQAHHPRYHRDHRKQKKAQ